MNEFLKVSYLLSPFLVGLACHGLCMKFGWLSSLARPIDAGLSIRGKTLFGANKMWRGVVAVSLGTAVGFGLQMLRHRAGSGRSVELLNYSNPMVLLLGLAMGAAAMLSELPNSFLKRRLGIGPGTAAHGGLGALFYVLDQVDVLLGIWIVLSFVVAVTGMRVLESIVFLFVAHQVLTVIGYRLGMRATAR